MIHGYALNLGRAAEGMPKMVKNAKIACIDFNLQKTKMLMGVQVLVNDPKELEKIREQEFEITAKRISDDFSRRCECHPLLEGHR